MVYVTLIFRFLHKNILPSGWKQRSRFKQLISIWVAKSAAREKRAGEQKNLWSDAGILQPEINQINDRQVTDTAGHEYYYYK